MSDRRAARAGAHRASSGRSRRTVVLLAAAVAAVVCLVVAFVLRPDDPSASMDRPQDVEDDVLEWTETELPADTLVVVPTAVRAGLIEAGGDPARLLEPDAPEAGALRLLGDETPPPGAVVLAQFDDPDGPAVTLVDPAPGEPTPEELDRRTRLAAAVLANPATGARGAVADVLSTAHLDARLLTLLSVLVARLQVAVTDFPAAPAEPVDGPPARQMLLDRTRGEPLRPGSPAAEELTAFLDAQLPPFAPDAVEVTDAGVLVGFRYASDPDALITASTP